MSTLLKKEVVAAQASSRKRTVATALTGPAAVLLHALQDAVIGFDSGWKILYANHAAQALLGAGEKALVGTDLRGIFDKNASVLDAVGTMVSSCRALMLHDVQIGGRLAQSVSLSPTAVDGMYVVSIHLQSQQVRTDWAEKARAALKPAQLMASTLAHEIKNPLAGIRGAAQLLEKARLNDDDRELLGLIVRETDRMSRLVEKVDIFGGASPENMSHVNIHEVIAPVVKLLRAASTETVIEEKYDPSLPDIHGHFDHLSQAVLNVVKNAVESGADRVVIRTFYDTAAPYHTERHDRLPLCIEVEDNGAGIDAEMQAHIFEPYFTTKAQGSGLGLSIVSKIIDDHGGLIDVTSKAGKTVFKISLPVVKS